jgi:hypothetical protein
MHESDDIFSMRTDVIFCHAHFCGGVRIQKRNAGFIYLFGLKLDPHLTYINLHNKEQYKLNNQFVTYKLDGIHLIVSTLNIGLKNFLVRTLVRCGSNAYL